MMPKPNQSKQLNNNNDYKNSTFRSNSERILLETKPSIFLYEKNFIFKIIVLFLLVFLFAPIVTLFYGIQSTLLTSFQLNFTNMTAMMELILMFCILIVIIKIILDVLDWNHAKYTLTSQRVIIERGFFHKEKIMMPYIKMQDIEISQTIFERLANVGDIIIYSGHDNSDTILNDISNPKEVEEIILTHMSNAYQQNYAPNYAPDYVQGYGYQEHSNSWDYNRNQRYSNKMDYNQNNHRNYDNNEDVHYYKNNENYYNEFEDEYDEPYNNLKYRYKDKWQKNNRNYNKSEMNDDEVIRKHQEMFKKYNK